MLIFAIFAICFVAQSSGQCPDDCCGGLQPRPPQTYVFYQNTGRFIGGLGNYSVDTYGYSGQGDGYLNPSMQCVVNTGPLPVNIYNLSLCKNTMHDPPQPRPCSFVLDPYFPDRMCGRDDFLIHGCQTCTPGDETTPPAPGCSAGCVVINIENRLLLRAGDSLVVESYEPENYYEILMQINKYTNIMKNKIIQG